MLSTPFVRSAYNYDTDAASDESALICLDESLAIQSAKDECDITLMLERMAHGINPDLNRSEPIFADVTTTSSDFHSAMNLVIQAQEQFDSLPAKVRERFANDPAKLLDFLHNPSNREEAARLGLVPSQAIIVPYDDDLSIVSPVANQTSRTGEAVEKSSKLPRAASRPSGAVPKGFKLVPDDGGDFGEEF